MFKAILARLHQKHRTMKYPEAPAVLPELFRGYPRLEPEKCRAAGELPCPTGAIGDHGMSLDLGKCLFCADCPAVAAGCVSFTTDHVLAARTREELIVRPGDERRMIEPLEEKMRRLFGRSLKLREVSAGGCNGCEADTNVLSTVGFDLGRFGIQFVASPRHSDGIFVTGPVTENMRAALLKTYEAVPAPKIVIAAGACAINGGPFIGSTGSRDGADNFLPVDLYIPGCPPHPLTILDGLLRLLGRLEQNAA